jgi:S1-C subfamily serine protease
MNELAKPPFPPQRQPMPGEASKVTPEPDHGEKSYRGSGTVSGNVAGKWVRQHHSGTNAGIGFAIPVDVVNRIVLHLIRDGRVPTPGIAIIAADEAVATRLGIEGIVVVQVAPGSPVTRAGLHGVDTSNGKL